MTPTELEHRLDAALHAGLDDRPVALAALLDGARARAVRIRRRRAATTGGLALLVAAALPGGLALANGADEPAARMAAPAEPPTPSATPTPTESGVPGGEAPVNEAVPEGMAGSVTIPLSAMLAVDDLGFTPVTTNDFGHYVRYRTLTTSLCGDGAEPGEDRVVGGREVDHVAPHGGTVSTVVRVFRDGGADDQMDFLRDSIGHCSYAWDFEPREAAGLPGDQAVLGAAEGAVAPGRTFVVGALRYGDVTVGVGADLPGDTAAATAEARRLLTAAGAALETSGLAAGGPQG